MNRKNQFVSVKMLKDIYTGKCHCPKIGEIKQLPCVYPPSAEFLRDEVANIIENKGEYVNELQAQQWKRLTKYMRKNIPEKQWLLGMLALIHAQHPVFKKDYKPPKKRA